MVDAMSLTQPNEGELIKALRTPHNRKITALHVAAVMGNARMCRIIAWVEPTLVDDRNADGETPLFLAALHGRKQAFLSLHYIRNPPAANPYYVNCRRNNGDTILHCAINGDHFGLPVEKLKAEHYLVREPDYSDIRPHCFAHFKTLWSVCGLKKKRAQLKIYRKKETHTWCVQVFERLLHFASLYDDKNDGENPNEVYMTPATSLEFPERSVRDVDEPRRPKKRRKETLLLMAAKDGVLEMIEKILELNPGAIHFQSRTFSIVANIHEVNEDKKNIVLLAAEHRQPHVYEFLLKENVYKESLFRQVDKDGNTALHLVATLGDYMPWLITGEALQMQWELKWYEFVKYSMPAGFICPYNNNHKTVKEIFTDTHKGLVKSGGEWLRKTLESCSVVAALIATVAFATATTVPVGVDQESGYPTLETEIVFKVFAASSLIALCCSVMAVLTFLSLLTSRFQEQDFHKDLPMKLLLGLTLLLMSIASMMVSFCAGHFFVLKHQLHHAAFALYAATCISVIFYVLAQFPLYFDY
ncbi:uncharacterized protein LOC114726661 [Neltuma alba]|uniref:uncharacterized protein LOC114726661 n=1 Tax=Neltuma alba TaxID=207710 RepID=UPI0010A43B67|nr:uncharacterized protein LOC114726661 [Prosopis alba]